MTGNFWDALIYRNICFDIEEALNAMGLTFLMTSLAWYSLVTGKVGETDADDWANGIDSEDTSSSSLI